MKTKVLESGDGGSGARKNQRWKPEIEGRDGEHIVVFRIHNLFVCLNVMYTLFTLFFQICSVTTKKIV